MIYTLLSSYFVYKIIEKIVKVTSYKSFIKKYDKKENEVVNIKEELV